MKVKEEALKEYIEIYKRDFGEDITMEEAGEITHQLITLYEVLLKNPKTAPKQ